MITLPDPEPRTDVEHLRHILRLTIRALDDLIDEGHVTEGLIRENVERARMHAEVALLGSKELM